MIVNNGTISETFHNQITGLSGNLEFASPLEFNRVYSIFFIPINPYLSPFSGILGDKRQNLALLSRFSPITQHNIDNPLKPAKQVILCGLAHWKYM